MDLRSHYPYWLLRHGIINSYVSLGENISTDVVIMGGGISGALAAWYIQNAGLSVVLVDRRHIGMGSTAASTALLQYEIDVPLFQLALKVGERNARRSYELCAKAIDDIESVCNALCTRDIFDRRPSLQFATSISHVKELEAEFNKRRLAGFDVQWMDSNELLERFGFDKPAGLLSAQGAELDAYLLTHRILEWGIKMGMKVYDHTEVVDISYPRSGVELTTADKKRISAKNLVIACGYESQRYIPMKVQKLRSTYAIASECFQSDQFWYENALLWETGDPYNYYRTTADNRVLMGGKDVFFSDPAKRDKLVNQKAKALEKSFKQLFPSFPFKTDFKWAGTFAVTKDGLPYIGAIRQRPNTYFALGFGGNGITFSAIAGQIIRDMLLEKKNDDAGIFSFTR